MCSEEEDFLNFVNVSPYFLIISPLKQAGHFIYIKLNLLHKRMLCAKFGWNWPCDSGEGFFFISSLYFHSFVIIPFGKSCGPSFEKTWIPLTHGCFVPSMVEIGPMILEKVFLSSSLYCHSFVFCYYLPLENGVVLHLNKLKSLHSMMLCTTFDWNEPSGSGEVEKNVKSLR